jgi:hypothetical protein
MFVALVLILPSLVFFSSAQTCPAGEGSTDGVNCVACVAGTYQEQSSQPLATASCKTCGVGQYTLTADVDKVCKTCVAGQAAASASLACTPCSAGRFQELTQSVVYNCKPCVAGKAAASATASSCTNCVAGEFQEVAESIVWTCKNCVAGKYTLAAGVSAVCKTCNAGQYAPARENSCRDCPRGKHQKEAPELYECSSCSAGFSINVTGHKGDCEECPAGYFGGDFTGDEDDDVSRRTGTFQPQLGMALCTGCIPGFFQMAPYQTGCKICPKKTFNPEENWAAKCFNCPTGKIAGDKACLGCNEGEFNCARRGNCAHGCDSCVSFHYRCFLLLCSNH